MSSTRNPWLPPSPVDPAPVERTNNPASQPTGPTRPQDGVPIPKIQLPSHRVEQPAPLWWLGVHGGSGESSLSALRPEWVAAEHVWPVGEPDTPSKVVLVARSSVYGLTCAQAAAQQWAAGLVPDVEVVGLVVVADAPGRLPRPLRELTHIVGGGVAHLWHVPWIEAWRLDPSRELAATPRPVRHLFNELSTLLTRSS